MFLFPIPVVSASGLNHRLPIWQPSGLLGLELRPDGAGELLLQGGAVFGVGGGFEGGPVRGGVEALVVGGGEPKFDGEFAFENAGMLVLEHETIVELDLELGWIGAGVFGDGFVGVEELQLATVGPGDGERGEFIEPGELLGREVFVEFVADVGGLGFLGEGEAGKGTGEAVRDGGGGERRKFQLGPNGAKEIHAGDELFHLVIEEREFEKAAEVGFGQAAAGCRGVNFALVLVVDHEVAEADEFDGGDAFVCAIEKVLDVGGEVLREHFLDPFAFDGGGQAEEGEVFRAAGGDFTDGSGDEERGVLDDAFAHEGAGAAFGEVALEGAGVAADAELVDEAGHEATEEGGVVGFV